MIEFTEFSHIPSLLRCFQAALETDLEQGSERKQLTRERKETPVGEWVVEMGKG